jgi:hypothetical protein
MSKKDIKLRRIIGGYLKTIWIISLIFNDLKNFIKVVLSNFGVRLKTQPYFLFGVPTIAH